MPRHIDADCSLASATVDNEMKTGAKTMGRRLANVSGGSSEAAATAPNALAMRSGPLIAKVT